MVSVVPTRKTCCLEITSFWNTRWKGNEQRWIAVGASRTGRILNIVFAVRDEAVRPVTGWVADKETARVYLEEWGRE